MPRWNFGSTCHYSVTEQLCWCEQDSPGFARISHGNFPGTPGPLDPQSTTELRTKEFTELRRAGDLGGALGGMLAAPRQPFWTGTQPEKPKRKQSLFRTLKYRWSTIWPCSSLSDSFSWKGNTLVQSACSRKEEEGVVISSGCCNALGHRHCICRDSEPPSLVLIANPSSQV